MSIRSQVLKAFPFLFEQCGFVFIDAPASDNEMVVVAQSGMIRLRFIQDRADFFLDVGNSKVPDKWIGLYNILDEMKQKGVISDDYKYTNKIGALSAIVRKTFPAIQEYLRSEM
jgi:hypothetical protein